MAKLQSSLRRHGQLVDVDGTFGPKTRGAVERFQRDQGLVVDGIAGPVVHAALAESPNLDVRANSLRKLPADTVLHTGDRGDAVRNVQARLVAHGAALDVDGVFGPKTEAAVKEFQTTHGLETDGVVGPRTLGALVRQPGAGLASSRVVRAGADALHAPLASQRATAEPAAPRVRRDIPRAAEAPAAQPTETVAARASDRPTSTSASTTSAAPKNESSTRSQALRTRTPDERSDVISQLPANDFAPKGSQIAPGPVEYFRVSPVEAKVTGRELVVSNVLEGVKKDGVYLERGTSWQTAMSTLAPRSTDAGSKDGAAHTNRLYAAGSNFRVYSEQIMKSSGMQVTTVLLPEDRRRSTTVEVTGDPTYQKAGGRDFGAIMARRVLGSDEPSTRTLHAPPGRAIVLDRYDQPGGQGIMRDLLSDVKVKENGVRVVQFLAPREFFNENIEYRSPREKPGPQPVKNDVPIFDAAGKQIGTVAKGTKVTPVYEVADGTIKPTQQVHVQRFGVNLFGHQLGVGEDQRAGLVALPDGRRVYMPLGKAKNIEDLPADELEQIARSKPLDHVAHEHRGAAHGETVMARGLDGQLQAMSPMTRVGRPSGIMQGHQVEQGVALDLGRSDSRSFAYNLTLNKSFGANQELAPEMLVAGSGSAERNAGMYGMELTQTARLSNSSAKARVAVLSIASPEGRWTGEKALLADSAGFIGGLKSHQRTFAGPVEVIQRDRAGRVLSRQVREVEIMNGQAATLAAIRLEGGQAASVEVRTLGQSMQYAGTVLRYRVMDADDAPWEIARLAGR